jgi:hypothetical protein
MTFFTISIDNSLMPWNLAADALSVIGDSDVQEGLSPLRAGRAMGARNKEGPLRSPLEKERNGPAIGSNFSGFVQRRRLPLQAGKRRSESGTLNQSGGTDGVGIVPRSNNNIRLGGHDCQYRRRVVLNRGLRPHERAFLTNYC